MNRSFHTIRGQHSIKFSSVTEMATWSEQAVSVSLLIGLAWLVTGLIKVTQHGNNSPGDIRRINCIITFTFGTLYSLIMSQLE